MTNFPPGEKLMIARSKFSTRGKLMEARLIRDPNCLARDLTRWFGWAFDQSGRLVARANADSEEKLLAFFESVATGPWKIHYWPPGENPRVRRVVRIEPQQQRVS